MFSTRARILLTSTVLLAALVPLASAFASQRVLYVDHDAASGGNGKSWSKAYRELADALADSKPGDQIWVAEGTYVPTTGRERDVSFTIPEDVVVLGGFAGTESSEDERNWTSHVTVLSGDIGQPGVLEDNSYHVVITANGVVVDGFTISDGYSLNAVGGGGQKSQSGAPQGPPSGGPRGGGRPGGPGGGGPPPGGPPSGAPPSGAPPSGPPSGGPSGAPPSGGPGGKVHMTPESLLGSIQPTFGAGMVNFKVDTLTVRNVIFQNNKAGAGGAMYNLPDIESMQDITGTSNVRVIDTKFIGNYAEKRGGAVINNLGASPTFVDVEFRNNETADKGGAVYDDFRSSPQFYNVLFAGNKAFRGSALGNDGGSNPIIVGATFVHNWAEDLGAGLYQGTGGSPNEPTVVNSIVWQNTAGEGPGNVYNWHHSTVHFESSSVEGGASGKKNVDTAPEFKDAVKGDYTLVEGSALQKAGIGYDPNRNGSDLIGTVTSKAGPLTTPTTNLTWAGPKRTQGVVYVSAAGAGKKDGSSWSNAFASLQDAIGVAADKDKDVWIAEGTYVPSGNGREASFQLQDGVRIYGGFAGTEQAVAERDLVDHVTILSGDLGVAGDLGDNAYHVIEGANGVELDGLVIQDGNADGELYDSRGGGLVNYEEATRTMPGRPGEGFTDVFVRNVVFKNNHATEGGALYAFGTSTMSFEDTRFESNVADFGGAMVLRVDIDVSFVETQFVGNRATYQAGAAYLDYGVRPVFTSSTFEDNVAGSHGGAVYITTRASQVEQTDATFEACTFDGNQSGGRGGAIMNDDQGMLTVSRSTFQDNAAAEGGGAIATAHESSTMVSALSVARNEGGAGEPDVATDPTSRFTQQR